MNGWREAERTKDLRERDRETEKEEEKISKTWTRTASSVEDFYTLQYWPIRAADYTFFCCLWERKEATIFFFASAIMEGGKEIGCGISSSSSSSSSSSFHDLDKWKGSSLAHTKKSPGAP